MNKIEIINKDFKLRIVMENLKVIYCKNFFMKHDFFQALKHFSQKYKKSEFSNDKAYCAKIKIDEKDLNVNETLYYHISTAYDYNVDSKLTSKTLLLQYIELLLEDIEYNDEFNTFKLIGESFINETLQELIGFEVNDFSFGVKAVDMNKKTVLKMMESYVLKEEMECNFLDFKYEDIVLFQLKIIEKISNKTDKQILAFLDLEHVSKKLYMKIKRISEKNNIKLLVFVADINNFLPKYEELMILDDKSLDFANEEDISEVIYDLPYEVSPRDLYKNILNTLSKPVDLLKKE